MIQIQITIQETPDGNISLRNFADGTATELEAEFVLRFRAMIQREMPKLYEASEATATQTKSMLDVQRFTEN